MQRHGGTWDHARLYQEDSHCCDCKTERLALPAQRRFALTEVCSLRKSAYLILCSYHNCIARFRMLWRTAQKKRPESLPTRTHTYCLRQKWMRCARHRRMRCGHDKAVLSCISGVATTHMHDPCPLQARPSKMVLVQHVDTPIKARFAASRLWRPAVSLRALPKGSQA